MADLNEKHDQFEGCFVRPIELAFNARIPSTLLHAIRVTYGSLTPSQLSAASNVVIKGSSASKEAILAALDQELHRANELTTATGAMGLWSKGRNPHVVDPESSDFLLWWQIHLAISRWARSAAQLPRSMTVPHSSPEKFLSLCEENDVPVDLALGVSLASEKLDVWYPDWRRWARTQRQLPHKAVTKENLIKPEIAAARPTPRAGQSPPQVNNRKQRATKSAAAA